MSVLENFKNIPRSPYGGATGLKCNFFFLQICNEVPGGKKKRGACRPPNGRQAPVAHPRGDRPLSPVGGATGSCVLAWPTKAIEFHKIPPASEDLL